MVTDSKSPVQSKLNVWCRKRLASVVLLLIVASMLGWISYLAVSDTPDKPLWLLVPLTVIYAVFTLLMAAAAFQNAVAARRSAEAMEASVKEQRHSRWAAFAAILTFPEGCQYDVNDDGSASVVLGNPYRQPMHGLWVRLWQMEGEGQIKYSTMMESDPTDVAAEAPQVKVELRATSQPESERVRVADLVMDRYRHVYQNAVPRSALCVITYAHRAQIESAVLVFDLQRVEVQS